MVTPGVRGPEPRTSTRAGAVSLALHGAALSLLIALGGKHLAPAPRTVLTPIEVVPAAPEPPAPPPPARIPTAVRAATPRVTASARREPIQRAQPPAPPSVQSLANLQVRYDHANFADPGAAAQAGAARSAGSSGLGVGVVDRLADGIGSLGTPEPPAAESHRRTPQPRQDYSRMKIVGASRFAGQKIKLRLSIDEHGRVRGVQLLEGVDPELDRKTALRVRSFEFEPALDDDGVAIAGTKRFELEIVEDDGSF